MFSFQEKTYFASLLPSGVIEGAGGEKFNTPLRWCVAFSPLHPNAIKKGMAYCRVRSFMIYRSVMDMLHGVI
jgi:hypothetical protein